jgi:hypothetical protein
MTTVEERILRDLNRNLCEKIMRAISDFVSLSSSADLDRRDVMSELMALLVRITAATAAQEYNITSAQFAREMMVQFIRAQKVNDECEE